MVTISGADVWWLQEKPIETERYAPEFHNLRFVCVGSCVKVLQMACLRQLSMLLIPVGLES